MKNSRKPPAVPKKSILPFILITSLFALWGFANAVTDPMVQAFKKVLELSNSEAAWVQLAFHGGYFCMALPAALILRKYTYKTGILVGLGLYTTRALLFIRLPARNNSGSFVWAFTYLLLVWPFWKPLLIPTSWQWAMREPPPGASTWLRLLIRWDR